ncbi:MAG: 50S ribosomal protein L18Ae [Archaeoglobaceae archaeon]
MFFEVKGKFRKAKKWRSFTKKVEAQNERMAIEKTYSLIGSNHKIKRNLIEINNIGQAEEKETSYS